MCRVVVVSPGGIYAWRTRRPSARVVTLSGCCVVLPSSTRYGALNIAEELTKDGWLVNHKRVAWLMHLQDIRGTTRRTGCKITTRSGDLRSVPDLVKRTFEVKLPRSILLADITCIPTWARFSTWLSGWMFIVVAS